MMTGVSTLGTLVTSDQWYLPEMGASGREGSLRHMGTKTVMSR